MSHKHCGRVIFSLPKWYASILDQSHSEYSMQHLKKSISPWQMHSLLLWVWVMFAENYLTQHGSLQGDTKPVKNKTIFVTQLKEWTFQEKTKWSQKRSSTVKVKKVKHIFSQCIKGNTFIYCVWFYKIIKIIFPCRIWRSGNFWKLF